ncbi:MAG: CDP-glucose 4,6-dehydratase [Nitrospinae bacterium]|nr:CDP-glucose 4,6-dehydratase [Nitrospinota bacterium]
MERRKSALENMEINKAFWRGRKVFITGHTGFKGGWLALWLSNMGAQVTGYSLEAPTEPCFFKAVGLESRVKSFIGDIRDSDKLQNAMAMATPEIVIHMASQPIVRRSYKEPEETFDVNVMGAVAVFESVRATPGIRALLVVTSDKCYENREWVYGYRETDPLGGKDPYSASKACQELVTASYRASFFANGPVVASGRAGNVIGGGDWAEDRLAPDMARAFSENRPVVIRNPKALRPWQHVLEPLSGYILLMERLVNDGGEFARGFNFGPADGEARPVEWMADRMAALWGGGARWEHAGGDDPPEAGLLKLDSALARSMLGWRGRLGAEGAVQWAVEWYKKYYQGCNMMEFTLRQIEAYESLGGGR